MPNTDTKVSQLVINELTKAQFDRAVEEGKVSDTELYLVEDEGGDIPENVFTADNLKGGKGIEIVPPSTSSGTIVSGFSDNDYIEAKEDLFVLSGISKNKLEIQTSFIQYSYSSGNAGIIDYTQQTNTGPIRLTITQDGYPRLRMNNGYIGNNVDITGSSVLELNKKHTLKIVWKLENLTVYFYSKTENNDWVLEGEQSSFIPYENNGIPQRFGDNFADGNSLDGKLFLSETFVLWNDDYYTFNGETAEKDIDYTVIGNPTIENIKGEETGNYVINYTAPYITEQYDDGQGNGYKVWSNKFCEQWGIYGVTSRRETNVDLSLLKEYSNLNYLITITPRSDVRDATHLVWMSMSSARAVSTTNFYVGIYGISTTDVNTGFFWKAEGYIL